MQPKTTAKDFFLYLSGFVALYASAISLISLLFAMVNKLFPDNLDGMYYYGYDGYSSGIRLAIATLIIIFPVYLFIAAYLNRYLLAYPDKKEIGVRKWLTYLTLFVTSATVITDLIILLNTFLEGEITTRFILKVLVVLVVAGSVLWYYIYDLKKTFDSTIPNRSKLLVSVASVAVLAALIGGFVVIGSPMKARYVRFDNMRINHLISIQDTILYNYWQPKGELPSSLEDLNDPLASYHQTIEKDPETGKDYTYEKTGKLTFKLCANFRYSTIEEKGDSSTTRPIRVGENENWRHAAGVHCYERTVDEQRYPVTPRIK